MRRIGDLMKDLGFNKDSPVETQKAFIRHLIRTANGGAPPEPQAVQLRVVKMENTDAQLSFDPEILGLSADKKTGTSR
jgi:hypothetical protein